MAMIVLIIAILTTLFCFLSVASTLRFIFSKQGWFWVLPFIISAIFLYLTIDPLYVAATQLDGSSSEFLLSFDRSITILIPLIIVFLWYMMIVVFRYALKLVVPDNKYMEETMRNLREARYLQKLEYRKYMKSLNTLRKRDFIVDESSGNLYPIEWVMAFDDQRAT
jgi:hypothetical protein